VLLGTSIIESGVLTTASALGFLVFTLLYTPCVAAVATMRKELKSTTKTVLIVLVQCLIAWVFGTIVYQIAAII